MCHVWVVGAGRLATVLYVRCENVLDLKAFILSRVINIILSMDLAWTALDQISYEHSPLENQSKQRNDNKDTTRRRRPHCRAHGVSLLSDATVVAHPSGSP